MAENKEAEVLRADFDVFQRLQPEALDKKVRDFLQKSQLHKHSVDFMRGARLAQSATAFRDYPAWTCKEDDDALELTPAGQTPQVHQHELHQLEREIDSPEEDKSESRWRHYLQDLKRGWRTYRRQKSSIQSLVMCCSIGAAVQGWDETAVNGAQVYYQCPLGIHDYGTLGLVNGAPYLMCILSCILFTEPLNNALGRKGTILVTCIFSFASCLGQAFVRSWKELFVCRLLLGVGIGPKTATIPVYAAESVPDFIRGAFVMQWQLWDAFGILAGLVTGIIFHRNRNGWRLVLGSPLIMAAVLFFLMLSMPESPRWHILQANLREGDPSVDAATKRRYHFQKAYDALRRLRHTDLQAARDLFHMDCMIVEERNRRVGGAWEKINKPPITSIDAFNTSCRASLAKAWKFVEIPTCRRIMLAVLIVMVFQQLCGVNALAYYSNLVFLGRSPIVDCSAQLSDSDLIRVSTPLKFSVALGALNFAGAIPALFLIDPIGRRYLLLLTFPLMFLFLLGGGLSYIAGGDTQTNLVITFSFLFVAAYSVGEGPVPLVYASESLPLPIRDAGMGIVTGVYWGFNFMVAMTWPSLYKRSRGWHEAGFIFYSIMCLVGLFLIAMFVPETRGYSLEEVSTRFDEPLGRMARRGLEEVWECVTGRKASKRHDIESNEAPQPPVLPDPELTQAE